MTFKADNKSRRQWIIRLLGWLGAVSLTLIILEYFLSLTKATMDSLALAENSLWTVGRIIRRTGQLDMLLFLLFWAICCAAPKKFVVLYIRKFYRNIDVISPDYRGGLEKRVRIVTLQDESFPSMAST